MTLICLAQRKQGGSPASALEESTNNYFIPFPMPNPIQPNLTANKRKNNLQPSSNISFFCEKLITSSFHCVSCHSTWFLNIQLIWIAMFFDVSIFAAFNFLNLIKNLLHNNKDYINECIYNLYKANMLF